MKNLFTGILNYRTFYKLFAFENLVPVAILSIVTWYISHVNGLITAYNDAMSHVNIARLVIDNQEPGLAQIGSVWLPLNHILPIVLVWNDWAWHSGFAGSIFSMISYVISVWAIYKTVYILTKKNFASIIAGLIFAFNLNMLYVQTTPLTEPLYIALFTLSVLVFTKWLTTVDNTKYLLLLGVLGFFQVIARYDGWFVVAVTGLLIALHEFAVIKAKVQEVLGKLFLYGLPVLLGVALWLLWNGLIFGDPLYFAVGPYSAKAQQTVIEQSAGLITKGDWLNSAMAYGYAILHNVGEYVVMLAVIAIVAFFKLRSSVIAMKKFLIVALLVSPIVFNILALYLGFSILNIPELNWNPSGTFEGQWFNVRYGLLALPFAAILIGIFASWRKLAAVIAIQILILQSMLTYQQGIITITDGTIGSSSFRNHAVAQKLDALVDTDDKVLMSISVFNPVAFESNVQLKQIVHEGVSKKWDHALLHPQDHAQWIVMSSDPNRGEPVRNALVNQHNNTFLKYYEKVYEDKEAAIYQLKSEQHLSLLSGGKK